MNQNLIKRKTQLDYILLDGSSSMVPKWDETTRAVDAYIQGLKDEKINSDIYIHVFSSGAIDTVGFDGNISEWTSLLHRLQCPGGGTPLYDAVRSMGLRMRDFDPSSGAVTIGTDGGESGSRGTDLTQAKAILDWMRAKGWPITFIGVDFSNSSQAATLGADKATAIGVQKALLSEAARNLAKKRARHIRSGDDIGFTEDEQTQFGGYLSAPAK